MKLTSYEKDIINKLMETITFKTKGVCSDEITFCIKDNIVTGVRFKDGCNGNLMGISMLVDGMPVEEVIRKLRGIDCEGRGTSCPDQLSKALEAALAVNK